MDKQSRIEKINNLIEQYELDAALKLIAGELEHNKDDVEVLCQKGKILTKMQQYGDALNVYKQVLDINPGFEQAETAITMIDNILKIRRTFYFENTYTDDELYC